MTAKARARARHISFLIEYRDSLIELRDGWTQINKDKYKQQVDEMQKLIDETNDQIHKLSTGQVNAWGL